MRALAHKSQNKLDDFYPVSWEMEPGAQVEQRGRCQSWGSLWKSPIPWLASVVQALEVSLS